jgi:hypothetical protein
MASTTATALRTKSDAAMATLRRQLEGLEPHLDRAPAPGEWTAREVLSHLLFPPGWDPAAAVKAFAERDFPTYDLAAGRVAVNDERRTMTLGQFLDTIERTRQRVLGYLDGLSDAELAGRKARIPFFKQFMGTDEIPIQAYVGAIFDFHVNDHAGQLAKIRKAVGLPEAR